MFNFIDIYSFIPVSSSPSALLCPGAYNVKTALISPIDIIFYQTDTSHTRFMPDLPSYAYLLIGNEKRIDNAMSKRKKTSSQENTTQVIKN